MLILSLFLHCSYFLLSFSLALFFKFCQVLPELLKLLAQLIVGLPKDGQNMVLDELYVLVAESDDVTRKPTLVSWLQSLSYLCSKPTGRNKGPADVRKGENDPRSSDSLSLHHVTARL